MNKLINQSTVQIIIFPLPFLHCFWYGATHTHDSEQQKKRNPVPMHAYEKTTSNTEIFMRSIRNDLGRLSKKLALACYEWFLITFNTFTQIFGAGWFFFSLFHLIFHSQNWSNFPLASTQFCSVHSHSHTHIRAHTHTHLQNCQVIGKSLTLE